MLIDAKYILHVGHSIVKVVHYEAITVKSLPGDTYICQVPDNIFCHDKLQHCRQGSMFFQLYPWLVIEKYLRHCTHILYILASGDNSLPVGQVT